VTGFENNNGLANNKAIVCSGGQAKSTVRAGEYQKMIEENSWSKADLARYLGVSRAWVTIVMRELE